jgi:hydroxymethylpyrimidine pyrophosphatase-like HAD family hydrolase
MIFASDLDRTLMYSQRAIEELGEPREINLKPVEQKDGNWVAYMTESSFIKLKELSHQSLFIPVTTRTTEQFKRFVIFPSEIPIKYAITANGAYILYQGSPMKEWSDYIDKCLRFESVSQAELLTILQREGFRIDGEKKQAEHLFFYYILNCLPAASELESIHNVAAKYGWRISLQGRKLYFIPKAISKGRALEFICNLEGMRVLAGAGDSILDWDFLQNCEYRFVPNHGELARVLARVPGTNNHILTKKHGVGAGEEIIMQFHKLLFSHVNLS